MTKEQINKLLLEGEFPEHAGHPELIETHISWVIVHDTFVYKIKKPIHYSFLDFSTLEKRKYYCEKEIELNRRLTDDIYLDVQPVKETMGQFSIGNKAGEIIDYATKMRKLDRKMQMDVLLLNNRVTDTDIKSLAEKIAAFHNNTDVIYEKDFLDVQKKFNDLGEETEYLQTHLNTGSGSIINNAIDTSNAFMEKNKKLLAARLNAGFFRDCHGDLHSRNIFLLPSPQPFDCIEFNDDYRQIDVLNEVAFLCMDLDAFKRRDLSDLFLTYYNNIFPAMKTGHDQKLFVYYKSYRANIRAKVSSLRARDAANDAGRNVSLAEADKYLKLMDRYMSILRLNDI
jgi:aminoglycoside phosphotransferase family enzyme